MISDTSVKSNSLKSQQCFYKSRNLLYNLIKRARPPCMKNVAEVGGRRSALLMLRSKERIKLIDNLRGVRYVGHFAFVMTFK